MPTSVAGITALQQQGPVHPEQDPIIGPGKAIDTNTFFVLSSDTLVNLNARDPQLITTGPRSIDPDTGARYGMGFPIISIDDFVQVQKVLVERLGIKRLRAVVGPSMGALCNRISGRNRIPTW